MRKLSLIVALMLSLTIQAKEKVNPLPNFAGKVTGSKVRMRIGADLDSPIFTQLNKGDLLLIAGEKNNFYAVVPPENTKFYIFSSYIVDNTVEAHRVNIRLNPNLEAPIVGRLQNKTKIEGQALPNNPKWIAIAPPNNVFFYVSKDYIKKVGDKDYYLAIKQKENKTETKTIASQQIAQKNIQETLNLPAKKTIPSNNSQKEKTLEKAEHFSQVPPQTEAKAVVINTFAMAEEYKPPLEPRKKEIQIAPELKEKFSAFNQKEMTFHMEEWLAQEADLFTSWNSFHPEKTLEDFYKEQLASSAEFEGVIESFYDNIQSKPGNYFIKSDEQPPSYLYSTQVDLASFVGKKVTIKATPRPNNNFAFPAYFVLEVQP